MLVKIPIVKVKLLYKPLSEEVSANIINVSENATNIRGVLTGGSTTDNSAGKIFNFDDVQEIAIEDTLISLQISNGEGDRSNVAQITFADPDFKIDKLLTDRALKAGGIVVPDSLFTSANDSVDKPPGGYGAGGNAGGLLNVSSGDYTVPPDGTSGDKLAEAIVKYCRAIGITDNSHIASILGNITIETNMGQLTTELGGENARYAPYYGRGLIQLTWKNNYNRFGKYFGRDWVNNPDEVKQLQWAIPIAVGGMSGIRGCPTFSGVKLSDFGSDGNFDFVGARKIVNGTDKALLVASESRKWLARIPQLALNPNSPMSRIAETYAPGSYDSGTQLQSAESTTSIIPDWTVEIQVELGWSDSDDIITSSYWFTGRSMSSRLPHQTTLTGRGVRYLINRTNRKSFQNVSLRQLMERIGENYGVNTIVPNTPATNKINASLTQNSETDYNFLLRVAKSTGYTLESQINPPRLILTAPKDGERVKVKSDWACVFQSSEQAVQERVITELPSIDSLVDGKQIGEGFSTTLEINYPTLDVLSIKPGTILVIDKGVIPRLPEDSVYCREYKVKAVNVQWNGTFKVTLDLYIPVNIKSSDDEDRPPGNSENRSATGTQGNPRSTGDGTNAAVAERALNWVGKEFKKNVKEMCMNFVRQVLVEANHPKAEFITSVPADGLEISKSRDMAASLSGNDAGLVISDIGSLNPGDIVHFFNTYGNFAKNTITHVGIATGAGDMIDRGTSAGVVTKRSISGTFPNKFSHGIRLSEET